MMLFESVRGYDNKTMMSTNHERCVPYNHLASLAANGYKFRVAGKITKEKDVEKAVKAALASGVGVKKTADKLLEEEMIPEFRSMYDNRKDEKPFIHVDEAAGADVTSMNKVTASPTSKQVRCIETGEVFKNQSEAARHFNIDPAQVSDSIKTGRKRSGYTFEKVTQI